MNKIAELGQLLIEYQDYVGMSLIAVAAVAVLILIIKALDRSKKRARLLNEINDTVTDINTKVDKMNNRSSEVIYIDNRTNTGDEKPAVPEIKIPPVQKEETAEEEQEKEEPAVEEMPEENKEKQAEEPRKFASRDCGVSRQGREYTLEELIKQIQE